MYKFQYPIGEYTPKDFTDSLKTEWINDIKFLPQEIEQSVLNLDEKQLKTPYREGGWTIHQVVHHVADSHINAYTRFKLALTENNPTIKPYLENEWIKLNDVNVLPINISITILHGIHARLFTLLTSLSNEDFERCVYHPDQKKEMSIWYILGLYAWHGKHHTAQITSLRERMDW